jgi:NADH-quinone oxidoreductase subunit C
MTANEAVQSLKETFPDAILSLVEFRGETTLHVPAARLHDLMRHCRDRLGFDLLLDISSLDHMGENDRWEMVYELYGLGHHTHLRVKTRLPEDAPEVDSMCDLWATADWHEREVYDMMGIRFRNHPDLRRILMWEGYPYYPLRKDFPLAGKPTDMPDVAFTGIAPLEGGPFVTSTGGTQVSREPRARGE